MLVLRQLECLQAKSTPDARRQGATGAATAQDRIERLERGEDVPGGLGKPVDPEEVLRRAGFGDADLRHLRVVHAMTGVTHENYAAELIRRALDERSRHALARRFLRAQEAAKE